MTFHFLSTNCRIKVKYCFWQLEQEGLDSFQREKSTMVIFVWEQIQDSTLKKKGKGLTDFFPDRT